MPGALKPPLGKTRTKRDLMMSLAAPGLLATPKTVAKFEAVREAVRATSSRRPYHNPGEHFRPEAPLWPFPPARLMSAQSI